MPTLQAIISGNSFDGLQDVQQDATGDRREGEARQAGDERSEKYGPAKQ
jgi:hypothetical protein